MAPPTNHYFSPSVRSEQLLYQDLIIEGLQMYGQDVLYIPRASITSDEILNEDYSAFRSAYAVEMYIANTQGFEGEGTLLSKFGIEIRDQATFIVARRRFNQLVSVNNNDLAFQHPREGDLVYLPLSNSLFEIKFVEHEKPFYRLSDLPIYELQCELFEYSSQKINTGIDKVDQFEWDHASKVVMSVSGGSGGFSAGTLVYQVYKEADSDTESISIIGEVADFVTTDTSGGGDLTLVGVYSTDGEIRSFDPELGSIYLLSDNTDTGWSVSEVYDLGSENYIPDSTDPFADNSAYESDSEDIIDFSEGNPFGEVN